MNIEPADYFKALGVETRLKIIELLKKKNSIGAKEIAQELGITIAAASQHLKILKHIGLVNSRRKGYWIPYSINEEALEHCSLMMSRVCSCHPHGHTIGINDLTDNFLKEKSIDELNSYRNALEKKLKLLNELLEKLKGNKE